MANHYTQFAETFVPLNAEQADFIIDTFAAAQAGREYADEEQTAEDGPWWEEDDDEPFLAGVGYGSDEEGICMFSESDGVLDHVALVVAEAQRRFNDPRPWAASAAFTCSRSRPGEFGGCAVFVHKGETRWLSTAKWAREQCASVQEGTDG